MHIRSYVFLLLLLVAAGASAQSELDPVVNQRQDAAGQELTHNFTNAAAASYGRFVYQGSNPAGSRAFGLVNYSGDLMFLASANRIVFRTPTTTEQMRIDTNGVQIGTNPAATAIKLTVLGAIDVKGNIAAKYQDLAEWVPSFGQPEPGTVVIVSQDATNHVAPSATSYDTRVAGVVSAQPGVILGEPGPSSVKVATTGRVRVRVDATIAPIAIGDLLVTSDKSGYAMKSQPFDIGGMSIHRPGTLIGKALESLESGTGEILVLLALQ